MVKRLIHSLIESVIRNISGGLGNRIRVFYYSKRFKECGEGLRIGLGVVLRGPEFMSFGDNVWIDDYCILVAGETGPMEGREVIRLRNPKFHGNEGEIQFGSFIHLAPYTLIHGFGGIVVKDYVSIASGCQIYSMSNHYQSKRNPETIPYMNPMVDRFQDVVFIKSPIVLERNCFLGINSVMLSGNIGENTLVSPLSLIKYNLPPNVIAGGSPAKRISDRQIVSDKTTEEVTQPYEGTKVYKNESLTLKKVLILTNGTPHGRSMVNEIINNNFNFELKIAQIIASKDSIFKRIYKTFQESGFLFFTRKVLRKITSLRYLGEKIGFLKLSFPHDLPEVEILAKENNIEIISFENFNDNNFITWVNQESFDLLVLAGTPVIKKNVYSSAKYGAVNIHLGEIPKFRGLDAVFWSILEKKKLYITSHYINEKIDLGVIIKKKEVEYDQKSVEEIMYDCNNVSGQLIVDTLGKITKEHNGFEVIDHGKYHGQLGLRQIIKLLYKFKIKKN